MGSILQPLLRPVLRAPVVSLPNTVRAGGGVFYDADAQAFFDRLPATPSSFMRGVVNDLVVSAKDNDWWATHDLLVLKAFGLDDPGYTTINDALAARQNLRQDAYHLSAFNSPTFTSHRGFQGDGASAYLSGFNPTTAASPNFQRNSANFGIWSLTSGTGAVSDAGYYGGANGVTIQCRDGSNFVTGRANQASPVAVSGNTDGRGLYSMNRALASGTDAVRLSKNGASIGTGADASTALLNAAFQYLRYGTGSYSLRQLAIALVGGSLTPAQEASRYNDIRTYLQAVGAVA